MSLTVKWLSEIEEGTQYYDDVELLFDKVRMVDTPEVRDILRLIEQGEYYDDLMFIDRFGSKLYLDNLSTGCKAALAVLLGEWDKPVSLLEVGNDAVYVIVSVCRQNTILLRQTITTFVKYKDNVDIICDGERFTSHDDFTYHMLETWR